MVRFTGKKNRIARRFGVNIFGRSRNPLLHKPNPPGQHGARRRKKSDYGRMLDEKQKLKACYGMLTEKQLVKYFKQAQKLKGNTPQLLTQMLESRLDIVVYRLKLAPSLFSAQQLVAHGHVLINGKKVDIRSFQVEPGMVVSIKEKSRTMKIVAEAVDGPHRTVPAYLSCDTSAFSGQFVSRPTLEEIPLPVDLNIAEICDFLAHST